MANVPAGNCRRTTVGGSNCRASELPAVRILALSAVPSALLLSGHALSDHRCCGGAAAVDSAARALSRHFRPRLRSARPDSAIALLTRPVAPALIALVVLYLMNRTSSGIRRWFTSSSSSLAALYCHGTLARLRPLRQPT